jgi:hypothetical protein
MTPLAYSFDLGIEDYVAMCMGSWTWKQWFRGSAPSAGILFIAAFFFLVTVGHMVPVWGFVAAGIVALAYLALSPSLWRRRYEFRLRKYYSQHPVAKLLGPHTLTIAPEGIESTGPYHRTFRAWPSITLASITSKHTLIYTIFGNVYILPMRAVADAAEVRASLEAHLPADVIRGA